MTGTTRLVLVVLSVTLFALATSLPQVAASIERTANEPGFSFTVSPAQLIVGGSAAGPTCATFALCPSMLTNAYGFSGLPTNATGHGQTVVIVDACGDPTIKADLKAFDKQFLLPAPPNLTVIDPQGTPCTDGNWAVETALDVEWAHVTAPGASIDLLQAAVPSPADMYGAWNYTIGHHLGLQISNSWGGSGCYSRPACNGTIGQGIGLCNSTAGALGVDVSAVLTKAAHAGITVLAAAGDSGAWGLGSSNATVPIPADCPGALTVGGTTLKVNSTGHFLGETAWSGSGGGYVNRPEPSYQRSVKIRDSYHSLGKPDVAADANPSTGVWIYEGGWGTVGGTSVACPLWAGFMADVNEIRAANHLGPAGFVNEFLYNTIYGVNGTSSLYAADFHDITSGNNGWAAHAGWDADSGLGSFRVPSLANTLGTNSTA